MFLWVPDATSDYTLMTYNPSYLHIHLPCPYLCLNAQVPCTQDSLQGAWAALFPSSLNSIWLHPTPLKGNCPGPRPAFSHFSLVHLSPNRRISNYPVTSLATQDPVDLSQLPSRKERKVSTKLGHSRNTVFVVFSINLHICGSDDNPSILGGKYLMIMSFKIKKK